MVKPGHAPGNGSAFFIPTFLIVAFLQYRLEEGTSMSIAWQLIPYCVLTISEILVSTTGLEFAYTQAPAHLNGMIKAKMERIFRMCRVSSTAEVPQRCSAFFQPPWNRMMISPRS